MRGIIAVSYPVYVYVVYSIYGYTMVMLTF